jgi:predicted ABC-type ATPase
MRPELAAIKAARTMLRQISEHARNGDNFAFETTLSGRVYLRYIREWRKHGYRVKLIFLKLATVEAAIQRVATRVTQGGHFVPDHVVTRRFSAGLHNFETIYRYEVDVWELYDNSGDEWILVDKGQNP